MQNVLRIRRGVLVGALALLLAGCSGGDDVDRADVYPVTGTITLNGAPVSDATVTYSPSGDQPVASGRTDAKGVYKLTTYEYEDGAAAGEYVVMVSKVVSAAPAESSNMGHSADGGGQASPDAHGSGNTAAAESTSLLNPKYATAGSPLKATVSDSDNTIDFQLEP